MRTVKDILDEIATKQEEIQNPKITQSKSNLLELQIKQLTEELKKAHEQQEGGR